MSRILVIGEDALTCALGERLVAEVLPKWSLAKASINTRGITKLIPALPRYFQQAQYIQPVLCIADTDGKCPVELIAQWLPKGLPQKFLLRLAVTEAESWLLSDSQGAAGFFNLPVANMPREPDTLLDAKLEVLRLARMSRSRSVRQEVVSSLDANRPGAGYNTHLCRFVFEHWQAKRARTKSVSLDKAMARLADLDSWF